MVEVYKIFKPYIVPDFNPFEVLALLSKVSPQKVTKLYFIFYPKNKMPEKMETLIFGIVVGMNLNAFDEFIKLVSRK